MKFCLKCLLFALQSREIPIANLIDFAAAIQFFAFATDFCLDSGF